MPHEIDLEKYHRSIADEIISKKDRVRDLIGDAHWGEDGGYKEAVLRQIIRSYASKDISVGTGFITYGNRISKQLDILITNNSKPTLFNSGDHQIVTPDCVRAIIEVKTAQRDSTELENTIENFANQVEKIRNFNDSFDSCWAGIFIYESNNEKNRRYWRNKLLECQEKDSKGRLNRVVNFISFGPNLFSRFWLNDPNEIRSIDEVDINGYRSWHVYDLNEEEYHGFSFTYFLGNLINAVSATHNYSNFAWFPIKYYRGKEHFNFERKHL